MTTTKALYNGVGFHTLITTNNPKIAKSTKYGYLTAGIHLAPWKLSGYNVCKHASANCIDLCLNTAGHAGIGLVANRKGLLLNDAQRARIARTRLFFEDRGRFATMLEREIEAFKRKCVRENLTPVFRPNLTSDLPWERIKLFKQGSMLERWQGLQFMDYTAIPHRQQRDNYNLTFSLKENNSRNARNEFKRGFNLAVVFKGTRLPRYFTVAGSRHRVVDGDRHDLRFLEYPHAVVGLIAKGRARKADIGGFVRDISMNFI